MRYILIILVFLSVGANAQMVIKAHANYRPYASPAVNLLLDDYPNAAAAYSLRKLDKDYTGNCIRVRRSNDNAESDIGFTSSGDLDTATLKTFVGANSGFVATWYDQSGNARNATQATAANQPRIANLGVIDRQNSKVTVFFDNTNDALSITTGLDIAKNISSAACFAVYRNITSPTSVKGLFQISTNVDVRRIYAGAGLTSGKHSILWRATDDDASQSLASTNNVSTTNYSLFTSLFQFSVNDFFIYINNVLENSVTSAGGQNTSNANSLNASIGGFGAVASNMNITELIFYNTSQQSNRNGIETSINSYYSIY